LLDHLLPLAAPAARTLTEAARDGSLVLFVGAGVSKDAGLPLWRELVAPLGQHLGLPEAIDAPDVAQAYVNTHGRPALLRYLETALGGVRQTGRMHRALARLPVPVIFTTNYDQLLERALAARHGAGPAVAITDDHLAALAPHPSATVIKLHGCLSATDTIVIARDDYARYPASHPAMLACLRHHLASHPVLFVGSSLAGLRLRALHAPLLRGSAARRWYALDALEPPATCRPGWREAWQREGVQPLLFRSFDQKWEFLEELAEATAGVHPTTRPTLPLPRVPVAAPPAGPS
jgi:transposase